MRDTEFDQAMIDLYLRAKKECGYNAIRFLEMVTEMGGLAAAQKLLGSDDLQYGFTELWERQRLDLSLEWLVLQPQHRSRFTEAELERARGRLAALGVRVPGDVSA